VIQSAPSQQTLDEWEDFIRFRLTMWHRPDLEAFADRGPAEAAMVTAELERRKAKKHGDAIMNEVRRRGTDEASSGALPRQAR
jgi:hypothetical protein